MSSPTSKGTSGRLDLLIVLLLLAWAVAPASVLTSNAFLLPILCTNLDTWILPRQR